MTLGLSLHTFTQLHVAISLIGIGSGLIVLFGLLSGRLLRLWTGLFLLTTVLTDVTGFMFPFKGITPAIKLGVISLVVLVVALGARYVLHLAGIWRTTFVITAGISLYLNVFVLVVQSFLKIPTLHALAPTQTEPPFKITQLIVLVIFIVLTGAAARKFRITPSGPA